MSQLSTEVDDAQALQLLGATELQQRNVSTSFRKGAKRPALERSFPTLRHDTFAIRSRGAP